jgi:hypothetical protein
MDEIWAGVRPWSVAQCKTYALSLEDLLAYLCYHADKHTCFSRYIEDFSQVGPEVVLGNTVSAELLWYADILRAIGLEGHRVGWDRLADNSRRWGIEGEVYASLAVTDRVFGTSAAEEPLALLKPPKTRWFQAGIYRRLMMPPSSPDPTCEDTRRRRLLESGTGLQFRPFKLLDILDYLFPDPARVSRIFSVRGPLLALRYAGHVVAAASRIVYCFGLLAGSVLWKVVARSPAAHR